ncbi:DUF6278 family protein [Streptomyces thinghirensis]|nr:DUF6278 family protein [Streptomyces thinghirensis]
MTVWRMNSFLGKRRGDHRAHDAEGIGDLLAGRDLLALPGVAGGVRLDDSAGLAGEQQVLPPGGADEEISAGSATTPVPYPRRAVIVRTVPGAAWSIRSDGRPIVDSSPPAEGSTWWRPASALGGGRRAELFSWPRRGPGNA